VVDRVATPRAEAIEQFAGVLRALRAAAGSPSFRTMSGRSHAISHTTLHEAAQGHRLPSWATTAEFVKACDADPAEFRERWEQANQIIRSAAMPSDTSEPRERPDEEGEMDDTDTPPSGPLHEPRRWLRHVVLVTALAGTLAAGLVVIGVMASRGDGPQNRQGFSPRSSAAARPLTAADCPVQQSNPPAASPPDPGDAVAFIADITLPDCTHVPSGSTSIKIWRFKNIGTVPWPVPDHHGRTNQGHRARPDGRHQSNDHGPGQPSLLLRAVQDGRRVRTHCVPRRPSGELPARRRLSSIRCRSDVP